MRVSMNSVQMSWTGYFKFAVDSEQNMLSGYDFAFRAVLR